ncbi:MAG: hypothetical protein FJ087_03825 [Deltaproteobacteria bacterium]|nr:hypothetical protein [Deltaproteobacteria bacterium]
MKRFIGTVLAILAVIAFAAPAMGQARGGAAPAGGGAVKSKFYDFSDQLIDGDIKKPTALYTDARQRVKFDRLLNLKKSFLQPMLQTAKEQTFK